MDSKPAFSLQANRNVQRGTMRYAEVIIAGGGPIGLFLAGLLHQSGITCRVLEKKTKIDLHSKSLGIHPVSLELFRDAGIVSPFLEKGLKIRRGHAFVNRQKAGTISFEECPRPFNFILSLPQYKTEQILEEWVCGLNSDILVRGAEITGFRQTEKSVITEYTKNGAVHTLESSFLIGCDGKSSTVRKIAGIKFHGSPYPDTYIMGDFDDNTTFGAEAAVYLHRDGLVECFPLPNGKRRWVVKTATFHEEVQRDLIEKQVLARLGHDLRETGNYMLSSFGVQHYLTETFQKKRIILAGDAAHVVSPIGGQGMNLGWLDAEDLADTLAGVLRESNESSEENRFQKLNKFSSRRNKIARQGARRAEMNMWLGRKQSRYGIRKLLIRLMMKPPLKRLMANIFTMRGLGRWWI